MHSGNKNNKAESKIEEKECKEDKNNTYDALFKKYMHDIRNLKTLDEEMINNICYMSNEQKMGIIISFNAVVENMKSFLDA
jgi:hypothetical protein